MTCRLTGLSSGLRPRKADAGAYLPSAAVGGARYALSLARFASGASVRRQVCAIATTDGRHASRCDDYRLDHALSRTGARGRA